MARDLVIPYYRPAFVAKTIDEVGDGTEYPMEVSVDQLAEMMYRVKDAWFTQGGISSGGNDVVFLNTEDPQSELYYGTSGVNEDDDVYLASWCVRGCVTSNSVPAKFESLFGAAYPMNPEWQVDFYLREPVDELGQWCPTEDVSWYAVEDLNFGPVATGFSCGLSHFLFNYGYPDDYGFYADFTQVLLAVIFTGSVAYVGETPFDPYSRLFVGVKFQLDNEGYLLSSDTSWGGCTYTTALNFGIQLSSGSPLLIPLYENSSTSVAGSDFILAAKKWWPYAKPDPDNPGSTIPVWDTATGAKL